MINLNLLLKGSYCIRLNLGQSTMQRDVSEVYMKDTYFTNNLCFKFREAKLIFWTMLLLN
jgi:hypothetical protein